MLSNMETNFEKIKIYENSPKTSKKTIFGLYSLYFLEMVFKFKFSIKFSKNAVKLKFF